MRKPMVAGNWKMNGSKSSISELLTSLNAQIKESSVEVLVCPPAIYIAQVVEALTGSLIAVGGQNASEYASGAYTGETSPAFLSDLGCTHVILGHSERRQLFAESSELVAEKFAAAQANQLTPILCVGETQIQRESGETFSIVQEQVEAVVKRVGIGALSNAVVAYEPVWAIGTGLTATPEQAQEVHSFIRSIIAEQDAQVASELRILYGGSVKASNAQSLFGCEDIDGGLIGGASLKADEFVAICQAAL